MTITAGARVGPYELLAPLGAGGMGQVWTARDTRLDRMVAVKFATEHFSTRFEREARAIAALNHPHICTLYDVGPDYLVMELIDGQPLAGPLPLDRVRTYGVQILEALDAAHRKGITHRDLKPANILVSRQGIKLLDFGLAKQAEDVAAERRTSADTTTGALTGANTILGTVPYMSPEQIQGKPADARSDIFAFGLVLYELLTGKRAFDGASPASVMAAIVERPAPALGSVAPPAVDRIVQKCLAKDPDERWQSARDLRTALEMSVEAAAPEPPAQKRSTPRAGLRWAAALALVPLVAGAAWLAATMRTPVADARRLSVSILPPPGAQFVVSAAEGGSAISPDGRLVAFVARKEGVSRLWVRALDADNPRQLADTDGAAQPFWSPDSRSLGYFADGYLKRIDVADGGSRSLTSVALPRGGAWRADGSIVFADSNGPLLMVSADGGPSAPLTSLLPREQSHRWPKLLTDGHALLYATQGREPGLFLLSGERGISPRRLLSDTSGEAVYYSKPGSPSGHLLRVAGEEVVARAFDLQLPGPPPPPRAVVGAGPALAFTGTSRSNLSIANDGTLLYTAGSNRYQLMWFGADGSRIGLLGTPDFFVGVALSPAASQGAAIIDEGVGKRDIWLLDPVRGSRTRVTSENRGHYFVWSPDGERMTLASLGVPALIEKGAALATPERTILEGGTEMYPGSWSSVDARILYTVRGSGTAFDIWRTTLQGAAEPLLQTSASELHPQISPDGRLLAFTSNESGVDEVYVQSYPQGDDRRRISRAGGGYPRWGPRGDELLYRALDGRLTVVPLARSARGVEPGEPRAIMPLVEPPGIFPYPYDVAADGRILALTPVDGESATISLGVLINWRPEGEN